MADGDLLFQIQRLQFNARSDAEALLLTFVRETFAQLDIVGLELRPQVTSLNSFNGFLTLADGGRLFFKTHVEQDNVIGEYYNAEMLASAGYPVIQPLHSSTRSGQQLLIYPVIESPSVFELARKIEMSESFGDNEIQALTVAQNKSDDDLFACYLGSLEGESSAPDAPIHQLFWHRLTGGRFERFYKNGAQSQFNLPHGIFESDDVFDVLWEINGSSYSRTLSQLATRAIEVLNPDHADSTITGHGDAHNGNVFYTPNGLVYFDPAFAGRHSPILDLVKPFFHNVFAMWMYFPVYEGEDLHFSIEISDGQWHIDHNYGLNPLREMFFTSKFNRVLKPLIAELKQRNLLQEDWREQFKLALMCCPLLTMNLTQFPPEIALLGLCFAVEMGAESSGKRSFIDAALDTLSVV